MGITRQVLIPVPALFSFEECLWFLNRNYDDCLHEIEGNALFKALEIGDKTLLIRIRANGSFLAVDVLNDEVTDHEAATLTDYVREWLDMDRSIQPFYDLLEKDARLSYMTDAFQGFRLIGIANPFEAICWCIIGQQINLSFAYKVKRRLVERFGRHIEQDGKVYYIFPEPEVLAGASVQELRAMQFSDKKAAYVIGIAKAFSEGRLSKEMLLGLPDFASRQKALTSFKGIGVWTANYVLMKTFKAPEGIPHGDIGLLNALANHNIIQDRKEHAKIEALFDQYKGWESYLVFYLWRSLTSKIDGGQSGAS
jgi:DNA-3-methyladenine glycosylase II